MNPEFLNSMKTRYEEKMNNLINRERDLKKRIETMEKILQRGCTTKSQSKPIQQKPSIGFMKAVKDFCSSAKSNQLKKTPSNSSNCPCIDAGITLHNERPTKDNVKISDDDLCPCISDDGKESVYSLQSNDLQNLQEINALVLKEKTIKTEIDELEKKEEHYKKILDKFVAETSNPDLTSLMNTIGEDISEENNQLKSENQMLKCELKDMKLEIRHYLERIENPAQLQLKNERLRSEQLENKIENITNQMACLADGHSKELNSVRLQLFTAQTNYDQLEDINKCLSGKLRELQTTCENLEQQLIDVKISEAATLTKYKDAINSMKGMPIKEDLCASDELSIIARKLSKVIKESKPCDACTRMSGGESTGEYVKELIDLLEKYTLNRGEEGCTCDEPKPDPSVIVQLRDDFCKCVEGADKVLNKESNKCLDEKGDIDNAFAEDFSSKICGCIQAKEKQEHIEDLTEMVFDCVNQLGDAKASGDSLIQRLKKKVIKCIDEVALTKETSTLAKDLCDNICNRIKEELDYKPPEPLIETEKIINEFCKCVLDIQETAANIQSTIDEGIETKKICKCDAENLENFPPDPTKEAYCRCDRCSRFSLKDFLEKRKMDPNYGKPNANPEPVEDCPSSQEKKKPSYVPSGRMRICKCDREHIKILTPVPENELLCKCTTCQRASVTDEELAQMGTEEPPSANPPEAPAPLQPDETPKEENANTCSCTRDDPNKKCECKDCAVLRGSKEKPVEPPPPSEPAVCICGKPACKEDEAPPEDPCPVEGEALYAVGDKLQICICDEPMDSKPFSMTEPICECFDGFDDACSKRSYIVGDPPRVLSIRQPIVGDAPPDLTKVCKCDIMNNPGRKPDPEKDDDLCKCARCSRYSMTGATSYDQILSEPSESFEKIRTCSCDEGVATIPLDPNVVLCDCVEKCSRHTFTTIPKVKDEQDAEPQAPPPPADGQEEAVPPPAEEVVETCTDAVPSDGFGVLDTLKDEGHITVSHKVDTSKSFNEVKSFTKVVITKKTPFDIDTEVEIIDKPAHGVHITTTITKSGSIEVITEGPDGIVETIICYNDLGNLEIFTDIYGNEDSKNIEDGGEALAIEQGENVLAIEGGCVPPDEPPVPADCDAEPEPVEDEGGALTVPCDEPPVPADCDAEPEPVEDEAGAPTVPCDEPPVPADCDAEPEPAEGEAAAPAQPVHCKCPTNEDKP